MTVSLSRRLGDHAIAFDLDALTVADRDHLVDAFVNWVGCALGGANAPSVDALARACATLAPDGTSPVLGRTDRFRLSDAVAIDCLSSAVLAFDDTHLETVLHPTGPVAAALLGQARIQPVSGHDFMAALHVGMELECRAGLAITAPAAGAKRGWYITGITGGIGAGVAVGRLLGFGVDDMLSTIGMAAARASGNRGTHGSMAAAYVPSLAAESGLVAAHLTQAGLTCGARAFDGLAGLLDLLTDEPATARALDGLGKRSEAARTAFKPYPSGIVIHPVIDACLLLAGQYGVTPDRLASLYLRISRTAHFLVANRRPRDVVEAQVSLYHWAAVALTHGAAGIEQAAPALVTDPAIVALQERIEATIDDRLGDDQCVAVATLTDGRRLEVTIEHAIGSVMSPMTSAQIDAKFLDLAGATMPRERAQRLLDTARGVLSLDRVDRILAL